jgi:AraC-like DNA-binding protein
LDSSFFDFGQIVTARLSVLAIWCQTSVPEQIRKQWIMGRERGFTRASALGPISEFVAEQGGLITRVFNRVDLPLGILETPDLPLPLSEQFRVLQSAARETGDPYFGARLGRLVRIENLSAFGKWVSEAPTVGAAIDRSNRGLNRFLQTGTNLRLCENNGLSRWSIEFLDPGFEGRFQNELLGVSYLIDVLRCFLGRSWAPDLIRVTGTRAGQAPILERIFNAPVMAGNHVSSIEFKTALLSAGRTEATDLSGFSQAVIDAERRIPSSGDLHGAVSAMISVAMVEGYPKIDWVASKLGMTRRTLQRRLGEKGDTFSRLLDDMLKERASVLLAARKRPITDIAFELGYSDPAHFSRAFTRWTGVPPSEFQSRHAGPAGSGPH